MKPRIKICCITTIDEARMAIEFGASAIGLVARMPSGPGPIPDELIKQIASTAPPPVATFLLTSETSADEIIRHHQRTNTNTIQIVDLPEKGTYSKLKTVLPSVTISENVDALLLDSGNPNLKIKELGGTGRVHNWKLSRQIRDNSKCPVFLAGGLKPENVKQAIEEVQPFGIDVCNGVRTDGRLDRQKLSDFFLNATGH
jgi:phosphoribosylanthranilate isomerase